MLDPFVTEWALFALTFAGGIVAGWKLRGVAERD